MTRVAVPDASTYSSLHARLQNPMYSFKSDHVASDDSEMETIMEMTRTSVGHAQQSYPISETGGKQQNYLLRQELNGRLASLEAELKRIDEDIEKLKKLRSNIFLEKESIIKELNVHVHTRKQPQSVGETRGQRELSVRTIDYMSEQFEWSGELKARMRDVFKIQGFRLCQEGVCNANMDGRDIVCVMPTGGGKSLTYQLPALLNPGCTLVISPLIALITDQILHLREFGALTVVEAAMLTGSTTKEESREIFSRLSNMGSKQVSDYSRQVTSPEIKLCYVTPEKIAKSKSFMSMLEKLASAGKLARIVIDEAHCVSQLGHDFRPDYKKLSILRQLFPRVPILALSATCPPKVLKDLVLTLRLKPVVSGNVANTDGTAYFSAPLYRKNLHYKVLQKPSSASSAIEAMADYILKLHPSDSGIVYCLSKKDAETVAQGLSEASSGVIKTGIYHADVQDKEKEALHRRWRKGDVKVVCATIAFGLGIDKGDVRFVLHHSMSKSLDGYYQESGRAGRDGKDSDCILYYRPQDATRLSALVCGELEGQDKLQDMLRFAQDIEQCRKLQFAKYFSSSSSLSMSSWGTTDSDAYSRCGHCDNCVRAPESIETRNVTLESWKILKIAESIERDGGRVTVGMLADLVRGAGGRAYGVTERGGKQSKGKAKEKVALDVEQIVGGKLTLSKDETETLIVHLLLTGYLKESYHSTAYAINVYILPGQNAIRLSRYPQEDVEQGRSPQIKLSFARKLVKSGVGKKKKKSTQDCDVSSGHLDKNMKKKQKRFIESSDSEDKNFIASDRDVEEMGLYASEDESFVNIGKRKRATNETAVNSARINKDEDEDHWIFTMTGPSHSEATPAGSKGRRRSNGTRTNFEQEEIIDICSE